MQHYSKPKVTDFGTLRSLTQAGCGTDNDLGLLGVIAPDIAGDLGACFRSS